MIKNRRTQSLPLRSKGSRVIRENQVPSGDMTLGEFKSWLLDEHKLELKNWAFVRMLASTLKSEQLIGFEQMNRLCWRHWYQPRWNFDATPATAFQIGLAALRGATSNIQTVFNNCKTYVGLKCACRWSGVYYYEIELRVCKCDIFTLRECITEILGSDSSSEIFHIWNVQ